VSAVVSALLTTVFICGVHYGEIFHLALHWLFGGSKWPFSATRCKCKHHLIFRQPLRAVAGTLAHLFGPTSAGCTAKGGVSSSITLLCCCHRGAPTKTFVIWLVFYTRLHFGVHY
jgi:hypothetical protein